MKFSAEKLKQCRHERNLSIIDLTIQLSNVGLNLHPNTLTNWENKKNVPNANDLGSITEFYNKPIQYFFEEEKKA